MFAATACAGPAQTAAPSVAAETQAAAATEPASAPTAVPSEVNGIPIKGRVNNGKGDYLQTTIADDDAAMTFNPAVVDPAVTAEYSPENIAEAHRHAIRFIAEEGIDSTINDGNNTEEWWARNKDRVAPEWRDAFKAHLDSGKTFVIRDSWEDGNPKGDTYRYSANEPRVTKRTITTSEIRTEDGSIVVTANVDYSMLLRSLEPVNIKATMTVGARNDPATGGWLITGIHSDF